MNKEYIKLRVVELLSRAQLFATPWTVALQAPLTMGFPRQEDWSGLPFPSPGDPPHPGQVFSLPLSHQAQTSHLNLI